MEKLLDKIYVSLYKQINNNDIKEILFNILKQTKKKELFNNIFKFISLYFYFIYLIKILLEIVVDKRCAPVDSISLHY
jgi:hypothetical protein